MNIRKIFKSDGHLTEEAVYLYTDALKLETTESLPAEVLDHVQECHECKHAIRETFDLVREQDYEALRPHPYFDQKKTDTNITYSTITRIAAAVVLVIGLAFLAYFFLPETDKPVAIEDRIEDPMTITPEEFVPVPPDITEPERELTVPREVPEPAELFAANFEPSPFYENLAGQPLRSHMIRIETPEPGEEITDDIYFSWETRSPMPLHLQLIDNTGNVIWRTTTEAQSVPFDADLDPGIYYWRLDTDDELLYVGKFIVPLP